jgi:hypothetical protein
MLRRTVPLALTVTVVLSFAVPAVASARWGAIALDPLYPPPPAWGTASGFLTSTGAANAAVSRCYKQAPKNLGKCFVVLRFRNTCGALVYSQAFARFYGPYIAAVGRSKANAINNARFRALSRRASVVTAFCSG